MSTITGDELFYPQIESDLKDNGYQVYSYGGATLRQKALLEFMCAIVKNPDYQIALDDSDFIEDIYGKHVKSVTMYRTEDSPSPQSKRFTLITTAEQRIAKEADKLTTAYINQLNKVKP